MMKILNFASANIDYVYAVDHIVLPGETIPAGSMAIFPGGKGLNQSVAAAKAGGCVYHAGFIGSDGDILLDILHESNVNLENVCRVGEKNGHAIIQVSKNAENSIVIFPGTNGMFSRSYIDKVFEGFSKGDIVLLQNEINNLPYILETASNKGMTIILNPSPFDEKLKKLDLGLVSYLILNETEAKGFFGKETQEEIALCARTQYPKMKLILTLGKAGCVYVDSNMVLPVPAYQVESVDTTAAGDCFTGYFAAQLSRNVPCEQSLRTASMAAAITVSRRGAAPSIPYAWEVDRVRDSLKPYPSQSKEQAIREKIDAYCKEHLEDANLDGLARKLGYSGAYVSELVRNLTGRSFSELLQRIRCREAAHLLRTTDLPVGEIIRRVGYRNESFFREKFRYIYYMGPKEYRKKGK